MKKALTVAKWEYFEKVKSKAFLLSLILTPAIMIGMGVLPTIFARQEDEGTKVIGMIDASQEIAGEFALRMEKRYTQPDGNPRYLIHIFNSSNAREVEESRQIADAQVLSDQIEGYIIIGRNVFGDSALDYRSKNVGDFRTTNRIEDVLRTVIWEKRARQRGLEPSLLEELRSRVDLKTVKITKSGEEEASGFEKLFFSAYIFLMMLFFLIFTSGQLLVRSVIEEKSNRIVEVLVSSCSPTDLMAGKVLGLSALGLTQIAFWSLIALGAALQFGWNLINPTHGLLLAIYFILGYLFYAAIFIAVGSPLNTEQEAQQVNSYLVLLLIVPLVLVIPALQNPNAAWLKILTYIPFFTPTMMALRIPIQLPSPTEFGLTIAIMLFSIYGSMWAAGRIFRVAILATGKRPSIREMILWIKSN